MRFRRKRSACIGLSLLLAIGSIGFPGYAREQEAPETSIEAPADEAAAQAAGKELMDGEVTQETSGMEDAGEMMEPAGQEDPPTKPSRILLMTHLRRARTQ